jgi:hypothetical protein
MSDRKDVLPPPQLSGSVNSGTPNGVFTSGGNLEPSQQRAMGILGTPMKVGPSSFPTIPSTYDTNRMFYPGLSYSYRGAAMVETPSHGQIRYATYDIQNIQLTMRGAVSTDVLAAWQLALTSPASIMPGY